MHLPVLPFTLPTMPCCGCVCEVMSLCADTFVVCLFASVHAHPPPCLRANLCLVVGVNTTQNFVYIFSPNTLKEKTFSFYEPNVSVTRTQHTRSLVAVKMEQMSVTGRPAANPPERRRTRSADHRRINQTVDAKSLGAFTQKIRFMSAGVGGKAAF